MSKRYFRIHTEELIRRELFFEASKEELRVLLALTASKEGASEEDIAKIAKCSLSRCKAALILFSEEGVVEISEAPFEDGVIEYEHGRVSHFSDMEEDSPKEVAEAIKRLDLSALLDDCATLLDKAALSSTEAGRIVSLVKNLALDSEYIIALVSYMKSKKQGTVTRIVKQAEELVGRGIDSYEALENYIKDCGKPAYIFEYRRILGNFGRALSESEEICYKKWAEEFCYSTEILALAYDKAVLAGKGNSLAYIDAILSAWHNAGCKTVAECEDNTKAFKEAREAEKKEHSAPKKKTKTNAQTPRYGNFDVEEAFKLALSRSYGDEDNN